MNTSGYCPLSSHTGERFLAALLFLLVWGPTVFSQETPPKPSPKAEKAEVKSNAPPEIAIGTIRGRVSADDGRVLANTVVVARALNGAGGMKTAQVDAEGRFALNDVPAAVYMIFAASPGYIDESLAVAELGQVPRYLIGSQLNLRLAKGGVVTGTVTNTKGEPIVAVPVRATPAKGFGAFLFGQGSAGAAETDDRGIYRIFGLTPGAYLVDAGGSQQIARFGPATGFELDVPTFYPSSTYDTAVPVSVRAGDEATGIDIRYRGMEGHTLSGIVSGSVENSAIPALNVLLTYAGTMTHISSNMVGTTNPNRSFSFDGVADGEYDLTALLISGPTENAAAGSRRVIVRGSDVTGVELVMAPLATLSGSIKLDPIRPENKCDKRGSELMELMFEIPRDDPKKSSSKVIDIISSSLGSTFAANGDFNIRNLAAGTYRPKFKLPTEAWYVRSITLPLKQSSQVPAGTSGQAPAASSGPAKDPGTASNPVWPGTIAIRSGAKISGVTVAIGQDAAGLRGRIVITPEKRAIPPDLRVHLIPVETAESRNVLRYFETAAESDGNFAVTNIPPGRYFMIPRLTPPTTTDENPRPLALDATARATLRREAEALNHTIELKPCQREIDVALPFKLNQ